jgi:hypothetical protein
MEFSTEFKKQIEYDFTTNRLKKHAVTIVRAYYVFRDLTSFGYSTKDIESDRLDCLIEYITDINNKTL